MSEMPPPPPANVPPPPPPGPGFDANAAAQQFKSADPLDLVVVGAGVLAFILSFFSWYSASYKSEFGNYGTTVGAWHGFFGWFGVVLLLAAGVITALKVLKIHVPNGEVAVLATSVLGALCVLLALFIIPGKVSIPGLDYGHGFSYWITLVLALASAGISGLKFAKARGIA